VLFLILGKTDLLSEEKLVPAIAVEEFRLAVPPLLVPAEHIVAAGRSDAGRLTALGSERAMLFTATLRVKDFGGEGRVLDEFL
ncbi:unnamed protein product, partial [Durusdinium trenchii]